MTNKSQIILFTDLDGTLLDHHSYSAENSIPAVRRLEAGGIPLIFCSSKTFAEQKHLSESMRMQQPFIVENGSGVAIPNGFFPEGLYTTNRGQDGYDIVPLAARNAANVRAAIAQLNKTGRWSLRGFADSSDAELSGATGLPAPTLQRARERLFTETLLTPLDANQVIRLQAELAPQGLSLSRGGRFHTIQAVGVSKGCAALWLANLFGKLWETSAFIAAVGDSPNDAPLLAVAHRAFLVQRHDGSWANVEVPGMERVPEIGPAGFTVAVNRLLSA